MKSWAKLALTKGGIIPGNRQRTRSNSQGPHRHRYRSRSRGSCRRSHSHFQESRRRRHCSHSYGHAGRGSDSPKDERPYNAAMDAMSRPLRRAARSPFSEEIEQALMPSRFTGPVEHVNHYIHMMSLHTHNDVLMCKVFPSSLSSTALRWFNGLQKGSIRSFAELIQEFGARFVMCSRVPQSVAALLSIKMGVDETLRSYASRWWW